MKEIIDYWSQDRKIHQLYIYSIVLLNPKKLSTECIYSWVQYDIQPKVTLASLNCLSKFNCNPHTKKEPALTCFAQQVLVYLGIALKCKISARTRFLRWLTEQKWNFKVAFNRSCCHGNYENVKFYLSIKIFHQYIFHLPLSFSLWAATLLLPWFGKWHILRNCQNCVQPP